MFSAPVFLPPFGFGFWVFFFFMCSNLKEAEWLSFSVRPWWPQSLSAPGNRAPTPSSVIDCSHSEHVLNRGLIISFFCPSFPQLTQILQKYRGQRNAHSPNNNVCVCRHCRRPHLNLFICLVNCRIYSWWGLRSPEHLSWEKIFIEPMKDDMSLVIYTIPFNITAGKKSVFLSSSKFIFQHFPD